MNARMLAVLAVATLLVLAAVLMLGDRPRPGAAVGGDEPLVAGLRDRVNDIVALDIIGADGEVVATLRRERERWRLREKHDYEADFAGIHGLLRDLSAARQLEPRTDDPQWHARLGVGEPGSGEGAGVLVRFPESDLPGVIIGRADPAGIGRFVRLEGQERAWLADEVPQPPEDRLEWLERAIMDIPAADLARVSIRHVDGQTLELRPGDDGGETWVVLNAPSDREIKPAWQVRESATALARLNMEDVRPHDALPESRTTALFRTRDGLDFVASLFEDEAGHWVHFSVAATPAKSHEPEAGESGGGTTEGHDSEGVEIDAVAVDGRLSPWQYAITESRYERMTRRVEDLLVPPEEETAGSP